MSFPSVIARSSEVNAAISDVVRSLAPDVVYIRYDIDRDWSGDAAIFFRVVLSDEASGTRLNDVVSKVVWRLSELLDFRSMGLLPYHNFRSESEQEVLREEAWEDNAVSR